MFETSLLFPSMGFKFSICYSHFMKYNIHYRRRIKLLRLFFYLYYYKIYRTYKLPFNVVANFSLCVSCEKFTMLQTAVIHAFMQAYKLKGVLYNTPAGELFEMSPNLEILQHG